MYDGEIGQFRKEGMRTADGGGIRLRLFLKKIMLVHVDRIVIWSSLSKGTTVMPHQR